MKSRNLVAVAILVAVFVVQMFAPFSWGSSTGAAPTLAPAPVGSPAVTPAVTPAAPAPAASTPRTVMLETFTAEWCVYCEMESQALYVIEHQTTRNIVDIGELHDCYSTSSCGDNYVTVDNTSILRTNYYHVTGFPTVVFDGATQIVGAANTLAALESEYNQAINNSLAYAGNVSIVQTASVSSPGNVTAQAQVTSTLTGSYRAIMYLVEYIGVNDSSHHDLGYVVRESLVDQVVSLTAGSTLTLSGSAALYPGWHDQKLSVITFIQQDSTHIIENANLQPVTTLSAAVTAGADTVPTGHATNVTVTATNSSTGAPLAGALVTMSSVGGGAFSAVSGVTDSNGIFRTQFTAPSVTALTPVQVTAEVTQAGYTAGFGNATILVNPLAPPTNPVGVGLEPQSNMLLVTWSAPSSGGGGVTYHVFRSTSPTSGFTEIGTSTTTSYLDSGLSSTQGYWYEVDAQNAAGFSANASAVAASPVVAAAQGLPANVGWWLSIDSVQLNSSTSAAIDLHLPAGGYTYQVGPASYAFEAPNPSGTVTASAGAPVQISASFTPRYALLQGTVQPATATVSVNGTPEPVSNGAFSATLVAGTYTMEVSSPGFETNISVLTLTPGNLTPVRIDLQAIATVPGPSTASTGGLTTMQLAIIGVAAIVGAAAVVGAVLYTRRGGRRPPRPRAESAPGTDYASAEEPSS